MASSAAAAANLQVLAGIFFDVDTFISPAICDIELWF